MLYFKGSELINNKVSEQEATIICHGDSGNLTNYPNMVLEFEMCFIA